jgi:[ribosomal protein S5]-alanine N-acetyltransferase
MMNVEIIETERLLLKGLSPGDMKYIFESFTKPEIKTILGHQSEEAFLKEEYKYKNGYSSYNRSFLLFLLTDKSSGSIIGRGGFHNWNLEHSRAEIGYVMEEERFKRKGLMSEAVGAIIDHGFRNMNLNRIEALVTLGNVPSVRIMEKYQFVKEGLLRQHYYTAGTYEDTVLFSKLYHEYSKTGLVN